MVPNRQNICVAATGIAGLVGATLFAIAAFDTYAASLDDAVIDVFKRNKCHDCHVPVDQRVKDPQTGKLLYPANRDLSYILDLAKLSASKYVTPGVPDTSELYKLVLEDKMPEGAEYCFDDTCAYPPVSDADRSVIADWIRALQ